VSRRGARGPTRPFSFEIAAFVVYNSDVICHPGRGAQLRAIAVFVVAGALVSVPGCGNKTKNDTDDYEGIGKALDGTSKGATPAPTPAVDPTKPPAPLPGVDVSELSDSQRKQFYRLTDTLASPCGKAHSLRTSVETDTSCKRALFAGRYVAQKLADEYEELEVRAMYEIRYRTAIKTFDLSTAPQLGATNPRVTLVEFMDYGCPHCAGVVPMLEDILSRYPADVALRVKHFPLSGHPDSGPAAAAAVAAGRQGKFNEMHKLLLRNQSKQSRKDLVEHARALGLDVAKFEKDVADPAVEAIVIKDRKEGLESGIGGTPTLFVNGREVPELSAEEITDFIEEELAVNQ
jgi:protein-disulfide isomerase